MLFLEILLSIHCLLLVSSWVIGGRWLTNQPSFKLKLARFLLVSCVISPLIVHCVNSNQKPEWHHYASIDALQNYANQPILMSNPSQEILQSKTTFSIGNASYFQLFYVVFCLLLLFRSYKVILSMGRLRTLLGLALRNLRSDAKIQNIRLESPL